MIFKDPPSPITDCPYPEVKKDIDKYIESDGKNNVMKASNLLPIKFFLMTTKGRVTSQWRRVALFYIQYGGNIYVIGSNNGGIKQPGWYKNALIDPIVWVQKDGESYWAVCKQLDNDSELRSILWDKFCSIFPIYTGFQNKVPDRIFPIVEIKRI
jgi:deazaflavin-dependent oxidoreductase (nitroreductase family)